MKKYVTTSSILAFKYKNGIITASDTQGSGGSLSKYKNLTRTYSITKKCIISYSGEYSDIQNLHNSLKYELLQDSRTIDPQGIFKLVQRVLYTKRSRLEPLNVFCIISGVKEGHVNDSYFLGAVNHLGNFYSSDVISNGLGSYLILPFLRDRVQGRVDEIDREEAICIMKEAVTVALYRDCMSINCFHFGIVEDDFCEVMEPIKIETNWDLARETLLD
ncbi:Proteasome subunit beta type-7 [Conglomerata obtusa]